jgi:hypothetical protein
MNPYRIVLLDGSPNPYNGRSIDTSPVGGIPLCTVRLAEQFAAQGCEVTVRNATLEDIVEKGVRWESLQAPYTGAQPDFVIANNDSNLFDTMGGHLRQGAIPVLWLHNLFTWKRLFKKKRIGSLLRWRPAAVFIGAYQENACSSLMPFRSRHVAPHGVGENFFAYPAKAEGRKAQAVFLSKPFRKFDLCVRNWIEHIHPACPEAVLKAYVMPEEIARLDLGYTDEQMRKANIVIAGRVSQTVMLDDLAMSACLLCPGHKDETFCNVAAESCVLGLPVVTLGIGSLSERVHDGNGILAKSEEEFCRAATMLLTDAGKRESYSCAALGVREQYRWQGRMDLWSDIFKRLRRAE